MRWDLPLVKLCWLSQIISLASKCLSTVFRRVCSMIFPGIEVRLKDNFHGPSFHPFLKMGTIFPLFQSPGTLPYCHFFSKMVESTLETTSVNTLRTLGCMSGPADSHVFRIFRSLEPDLLLQGEGLCSPSSMLFPFLISYSWGTRALVLHGTHPDKSASSLPPLLFSEGSFPGGITGKVLEQLEFCFRKIECLTSLFS